MSRPGWIADDPMIRRGLAAAREQALLSSCSRGRGGSVIMVGGEVVGRGFNHPPGGLESQRRCDRRHELAPGFRSDHTCCCHAEAVCCIAALRRVPDLAGGFIFFARVDAEGRPLLAEIPYCTICSKLILEVGLSFVVLEQAQGPTVYDAESYNDLSFAAPGRG